MPRIDLKTTRGKCFLVGGLGLVVAVGMVVFDEHATWSAAIELTVICLVILAIGVRTKDR